MCLAFAFNPGAAQGSWPQHPCSSKGTIGLGLLYRSGMALLNNKTFMHCACRRCRRCTECGQSRETQQALGSHQEHLAGGCWVVWSRRV